MTDDSVSAGELVPGYYPDPTGIFELRFYDPANGWSERCIHKERKIDDPLEGASILPPPTDSPTEDRQKVVKPSAERVSSSSGSTSPREESVGSGVRDPIDSHPSSSWREAPESPVVVKNEAPDGGPIARVIGTTWVRWNGASWIDLSTGEDVPAPPEFGQQQHPVAAVVSTPDDKTTRPTHSRESKIGEDPGSRSHNPTGRTGLVTVIGGIALLVSVVLPWVSGPLGINFSLVSAATETGKWSAVAEMVAAGAVVVVAGLLSSRTGIWHIVACVAAICGEWIIVSAIGGASSTGSVLVSAGVGSYVGAAGVLLVLVAAIAAIFNGKLVLVTTVLVTGLCIASLAVAYFAFNNGRENVAASVGQSNADIRPKASGGSSDGDTFQMGKDVAEYPDGLAMSVSAPAAFTPNDYAFGVKKGARNFSTTLKLTNGGTSNFSAFGAAPTTTAGEVPCEGIFDSGSGMNGAPTSMVLPQKSLTWKVAFSCEAKAGADLTLQVSPGFTQSPSVFVGKLP